MILQFLIPFDFNSQILSLIIMLATIFTFVFILFYYYYHKRKKIIKVIKRENLYRTLFDNTGTGIILVDKSLNIKLANSEFEKLCGFEKQDIENKLSLKNIIKPDYSFQILDNINSISENKQEASKSLQIILTDKSGLPKHCLCKVVSVKGYNNFIVCLTDISTQTHNEKILTESREQYRAILNAIPNLIFSVNNHGRIIDKQKIRNKDLSFFLFKPEIGEFITNLFPEEFKETITENLNEAISSDENKQFEISLKNKDNQTLHFEIHFVPVRTSYILFILQDITDRIEKEKTIRILGHAVMSVSECINITDENNIIQFVNQAFLDTYGYTEEEVIGKPVNMIVSDNNSETLLKKIKDARLKGSWQGEVLNIKKSGEEFPVYLSTSLVKDDHSKTIAIFAVAIDISERIKQTNAITRLNKELSEKNKELEQIIYIASHDLRSPLINIEGFSSELTKSAKEIANSITEEQSEMLKKNEQLAHFIFDEMPDCLEYIKISTKKMDTLIAGLLKISRLGRGAICYEKINMNQLINNVLHNFSFQFSRKNSKLNIKDLPDCNGDIMLLNQAFSNIISNAIKYASPDREHDIEIGGFQKENSIVYYVRDNGVGIPENKLEDIFKIFLRLHNDSGGDGLGLAIVKKIINRHNGRIWVENNETSGCTFYIELPVD